MFDVPLPVPANTRYQNLGIGPEAGTEEIQDAITQLNAGKSDRKEEIDGRIAQVYEQVPELRAAEERVAHLAATGEKVESGIGKQLATAEWTAARKMLAACEAKARRVDAEFLKLQKESSALKAEIELLNGEQLYNVAKRAEYDRAHPPLELFKLTDCTRDAFADADDHRLALTLLRRELCEFLAAGDEEVFHSSDLTRDDFSADFASNPILEDPEP